MVETYVISGGVLISVIAFLIKWFLNDLAKKIDLIFKKLDEMAKQSDINSIHILLEKQEKRIRAVEDTINRCPNCPK